MMIIAKRVVSDMHTTFNSCLIEPSRPKSGGGRSLLTEAIRAAERMGERNFRQARFPSKAATDEFTREMTDGTRGMSYRVSR